MTNRQKFWQPDKSHDKQTKVMTTRQTTKYKHRRTDRKKKESQYYTKSFLIQEKKSKSERWVKTQNNCSVNLKSFDTKQKFRDIGQKTVKPVTDWLYTE